MERIFSLILVCLVASLVVYGAANHTKRCKDSSINCYYGRWTRYGACSWNNHTRAGCPRVCGLCNVNCERLPVGERRDCGWAGIVREECLLRGCCWNPDRPGTVWCHYSKNATLPVPKCKNSAKGCHTLGGACGNRYGPKCERSCNLCEVKCERLAKVDRHDCGWSGITYNQCYERGCCWDDTTPGAPYCYYSKDDY